MYVISKVQEKRIRLEWNGKHRLLVYVDGVNMLEILHAVSKIQKSS